MEKRAEKAHLYEGDGILLFCEKAKGFIFSPPPLDSQISSVSIHSIKEISQVTEPGFPNVHYASFKIEPRTCIAHGKDRASSKVNKELVYGRKVHLYHVASKWYLSFDNKHSDKRIDHEIASLVAKKDDATVFRIIPSDPTKSTGQTISVEDNVRLEIISQQGPNSQALCVPNLLNFSGYDLKKASDGSDFTIYSQSTGQKMGPPLALRGGEVVMFLNEKRDAVMTVLKDIQEDATDDDQDDSDQVIAKVSDGSNRAAFNGGDSYWQIENAEVQYDGNWVDCEDTRHIRIKHLPSKKYLVLVKNEKDEMIFKLEEMSKKEDSVFVFEEDRIDSHYGLLKRRYVLIKHVHTNNYVTLNGKSSKLIDGIRCFKISPESSTDAISDYRDQKFWIEEVDEEILRKFSALYGVFSDLHKYWEKLNEHNRTMSIAAPTPTLGALAKWTEDDSSEGGSRQRWPDMIRAIKGVELVLEFLDRPTDQSILSVQRDLCTVLENYIKAASDESQIYLISKEKLLKTLLKLMGRKVGAENVLSALIRCHSFGTKEKENVLKTFFDESDDQTILDKIEKNQDFEFLKCLSALCMSGGKAEQKIQRDLVDKVIIPGHKQGVFFKIIREGNHVTVQKPRSFTDSDNPHLEDLIVQIEFYASVCEGVNMDCIKIMTAINEEDVSEEILTYGATNICIEHYEESPDVQSVFYSYLVSAMVDKNAEESGTDLDNIWYIYSWVRFTKQDESFQPILLSGLANTHDIVSDKQQMIDIQNKIQDSLDDQHWANDIEQSREDLMTQRLRVLETLVAYGFYWKADVGHGFKIPKPSVVIEALIKILEYRAPTDDKQLTLARLQSRAIKVLNLFLHQTYHLATSRIMFDYRYFKLINKQPLTVANQENFVVPIRSLSKLTEPDFQVERQRCLIDREAIPRRVEEARDRLKWILYEETAAQFSFPGQSLQMGDYDYKDLNIYDSGSINLQNLLLNFLSQKDDHLRVVAAKLFFDLFKGESFMCNRSEKSLIVLESYAESWETYTTMVKYATYQDKDADGHVRALLRMMQGKGTEEPAKTSITTFANDVVGVSGVTPWPDGSAGMQPRDETYINITGQRIILTTGVFGLFLNYVVKYSTTDDAEQREILEKICKAMVSIIRGNDDVKEAVFARFDDLLHGVSPMAHMLTEVITDNIAACRKLPHSTVWKMFRLATNSDNKEFYEFIPTIEAWMKVGKSSPHLLKTNQRFVTTLYEQYFKDYHETSWVAKTSPLEMLKEDDNDKFVLLTHLLAICCEGIHKYSEDCARNVFRISTLIQIIIGDVYDTGIFFPLEKRLPFIMVLNEAFLKTERESLVSVMKIAKHEKFWEHVEKVTGMIDAVKVKLDGIRKESTKKPKRRILYCQMVKIKVLFSQHFTHMYWKDHKVYKTNFAGTYKEEELNFDGTKISLSVLYQYVIEGVLPMLCAFAEEYTKLWTLYKERLGETSRPLSEEHGKILFEFGKSIKDLVSNHGEIFAPTEHHKTYWETSLKPIFDGKSIFSPDDKEMMDHRLNVKPFEYKTAPTDEGERKLVDEREEEKKINTDFQTYLENLKNLINFNDLNDIEASLYPKGPGFQHLVKRLFKIEDDRYADENAKKANSETVEKLVDLLNVLHKQILQHHDSKELGILNELCINILQVLSNVLYQVKQKQKDEKDSNKNGENSLSKWQEIFREKGVHKTCMAHLNYDNPEIVLQILGLLRLFTDDANIESQKVIFEEISGDRDSVFCRRVYELLEEVISTFSETWAKMEMPSSTKATNASVSQKQKQRQRSQLQRLSIQSGDQDETDEGIALVSPTDDSPPIALTTTTTTTTPTHATSADSPGSEEDLSPQTGTLEVKSLDDNIRTASIVLECISALCDGQYRKIQGYLLDQDQSFKKLAIIKRIAILLDVLTEEYEKVLNHDDTESKRVFYYLDLIEKAIQALIETTAGNYQNQQAVFQCQITDTINSLLVKLVNDDHIPTETWTADAKDDLLHMKQQLSSKSIELLQVLLEETDNGSHSLITNFTEDVDLDAIITAMLEWKDIEAYHILRLVANSQGILVDRLVHKRIKWVKATEDLWKDFKARSRCIEVLYQPNKEEDKKILTKVYFDFDPLDEVREEGKETVTNAIIEQSQEQNLTEFNKWGRAIRKNANYIHKMNKDKWIWAFRFIYETSGPRHLMLVLLTVLLNLLVLSVFVVPEDRTFNATGKAPNFILFPLVPDWYYPTLLPILGGLHIILSLWMVLEFIIKEIPNLTSDVFFINAFKSLWNSFTRWVSQQEVFKKRCPKDWRLKQKRRKPKNKMDNDEFEDLYYYEDEDDDGYFKVDVFGFQSMYRLIFLFCSIIAIPFRGYPYCICLFYVFLKVDVVQHIIEALTRSRKQLFFVGLISASVLLVFAIIGFIFIHDYFEASSPLFCDTLWECFISISREGLLDTLGPAIPFTIAAQGDDATPSFTHYVIRTLFYDLPFFLIVTTIVLNIVTAVLIDRFSDLREERDTVESNKTKACFICGIETETFERFGKGFRDHVKEDHNKWNYIYYLIYLDRKPRNDLTALGKQIADNNKIDERFGKTDHYPIKMAKVLPKDKQGDDGSQ